MRNVLLVDGGKERFFYTVAGSLAELCFTVMWKAEFVSVNGGIYLCGQVLKVWLDLFSCLVSVKSERKRQKGIQTWYLRNFQPTQMANNAEIGPFAFRKVCSEEKSEDIPGQSFTSG